MRLEAESVGGAVREARIDRMFAVDAAEESL